MDAASTSTPRDRFEQACIADRRLWAWLQPAMVDWQIISMAMTASLYAVTHTTSWPLKATAFLAGMWVCGIMIHRLALLGHDAGHRTVCKSAWWNDALAVFFVLWPMLISLHAWRIHHNEGHHPRHHTGTLSDADIVFQRVDGAWALPPSKRRMWRDIVLSLFGAMVPRAVVFVASLASPRCQARSGQALTWWLARRGEPAGIHPVRSGDLPSAPVAIATDLLAGFALIAGRFGLTALFTWGVLSLMGQPQLTPLVLAMFYGGYVTSFWTVFRLRRYCEHVGGHTLPLAEPPAWLRALVLPHGAWRHGLHHEMPDLPFHRYKAVLQARRAQGIAVADAFRLFETSPPLASGKPMQPSDPRSPAARAHAEGLLRDAVPGAATAERHGNPVA